MLADFFSRMSVVMRAFSAFSILPSPDYSRHISTSSEMVTKAWQMTGDLLYQAVEKVGGKVHAAGAND